MSPGTVFTAIKATDTGGWGPSSTVADPVAKLGNFITQVTADVTPGSAVSLGYESSTKLVGFEVYSSGGAADANLARAS